MALVRIALMSVVACGLTAATDLGIDLGSPVASGTKVKAAVFSVRTHGCASGAKFTGSAKDISGAEETLSFVAGTPGAYAVARIARAPWLAVITADCDGAKAGAIVPVNAQGLYDRDNAKFVSHAPTAAEVDEALKKLQGGSK